MHKTLVSADYLQAALTNALKDIVKKSDFRVIFDDSGFPCIEESQAESDIVMNYDGDGYLCIEEK